MSLESKKPRFLVAEEEQDKISRNVLKWLNTFPEIPDMVDTINYEFLKDDITGMTLSTIQGAYVAERYILGGYKAEYPFKVIYRIKPGNSMDKRLKADELLDHLGNWASRGRPDLGEGLRSIRVGVTSPSSMFAVYENGDVDHQILMKLTYEVI